MCGSAPVNNATITPQAQKERHMNGGRRCEIVAFAAPAPQPCLAYGTEVLVQYQVHIAQGASSR